MSAQFGDIIAAAAARYGQRPEDLLRVAEIESGLNANARNPRSSAGGLFQFIDSTAKQYGLADRFDATQASDAAARLMRDNATYLARVLGRAATGGELYLAHQQGAGGAAKILSNPGARATDTLGAKAVALNGGRPDMTNADFAALWTGKFGGGAPIPPAGKAAEMAAKPGLVSMMAARPAPDLSGIAAAFMQRQADERRQREEEATAEQIRKAALFGGGGLAGLFG